VYDEDMLTVPALANCELLCRGLAHHASATLSTGTIVPSQRVVSLLVTVTLYPDAPATVGSPTSPSWNMLLIVASDGLLITGAIYVLCHA